jgi:hypothetical protein
LVLAPVPELRLVLAELVAELLGLLAELQLREG